MKKFIFTVYTIAVLAVVPASIYGYLHSNNQAPTEQKDVKVEEQSSLSNNEVDSEVSIKLLSIVRGV